MKILRLIILLFLSFACFVNLLYSQTKGESRFYLPWNLGFYGNANFDFWNEEIQWYDANTNQRVGSQSPNFIFTGFGLGGIINYPITNTIFLTGRIGYNYSSGKINFYSFDYSNSTYSVVEDTFKLTVSYIELTPGITIYDLIPGASDLYLLGALEIGPFVTKSLENLFNGTKVDIPNVKTRIAGVLGLGYTFRLSPTILLSPELSFRIPFNDMSNTTYTTTDAFGNIIGYHTEKLSFSQLRIGASLTFAPAPEVHDEYYKETMPAIAGFKEIRTYDDKGRTIPVEVVRVEDIKYQELFPIVPYVFFEENSATPAPNTQILLTSAERGEFNTNQLEMDALEINKRTLDIVGYRLKNNPQAELTITGTIDGSKKESQNKTLARERADFAKNYLVTSWGINQERINIRTTGLPSKPSTNTDPEGVAENRRAELSSSNPDILAPIVIEGENQRIAEPGIIEFVPFAQVADSIASWEIDVYQGDKLLRQTNGSGQPKPLQWNIRPNELASKQIPVDYKLTVETVGGLRLNSSGSIPVEYFSSTRKKTEDLPDRTISKFSLVLFDFDKSDVSATDQEIIKKYIVPAIKYNSTVKIYGYTDRIGNDEYNLNLATRRADAVKSIILKYLKDAKIETYGVGERTLLFDNDLPNGRHLSRTVQVLVITPR